MHATPKDIRVWPFGGPWGPFSTVPGAWHALWARWGCLVCVDVQLHVGLHVQHTTAMPAQPLPPSTSHPATTKAPKRVQPTRLGSESMGEHGRVGANPGCPGMCTSAATLALQQHCTQAAGTRMHAQPCQPRVLAPPRPPRPPKGPPKPEAPLKPELTHSLAPTPSLIPTWVHGGRGETHQDHDTMCCKVVGGAKGRRPTNIRPLSMQGSHGFASKNSKNQGPGSQLCKEGAHQGHTKHQGSEGEVGGGRGVRWERVGTHASHFLFLTLWAMHGDTVRLGWV